MRIVKTALMGALALAAGCSGKQDHPRPAGLTTPDTRAYAMGRRREIDLTSAALALLPCAATAAQRTVLGAGAAADRVESDAASRAGISLNDYRRLVARVDSTLRTDSASPDHQMQTLDSLRVRLTVLRTRVTAEMAEPPDTSRRNACTAHW